MHNLIHLNRISRFLRRTLQQNSWPAGCVLVASLYACSVGPKPGIPESQPGSLATQQWISLFDGGSLDGWEVTSFGGEGEVELKDGKIILPMGSPLTGVRLVEPLPITIQYELEVEVSREMGTDFFCGLTLPVDESFATIILGGWGGGLCGLSCVNEQDASMNSTMSFRSFEYHKNYLLKVRVEDGGIFAWVDGEELFALSSHDKRISLRTEMLPTSPLGISSFLTKTAIHAVRWRPIQE